MKRLNYFFILLLFVFTISAAQRIALSNSCHDEESASATAPVTQATPPPQPALFDGVDDVKVDIDEIKAAYAYDHAAPLNITVTGEKDFPAYTKISFTYDSLNGGKVPAIIMIPKSRVKPMKEERASAPGLYPAIFFMHFHVSDKSMADIFATWPGYGLAVMAIDGVFRGDREEKDKDILMPDPVQSAANMQLQVKDILRGFDVLSTWQGIDPQRIGYMGVSMGALTGSVATGLDSRIKSVILADGAADFSLMFENSDYGSLQRIKQYMDERDMKKRDFVDVFKYVEPAIFVPLLEGRPLLFLNGKQDTTMSMPAMLKLHEVAGADKRKVIWYDSGHILPFDRVVGDSLKWFRMTL